MASGMLGKKIGMTQLFDESGKRIPITIVELPDNRILQVKNKDTDGYDALKLGVYDKKEKLVTKPELGASKAGGGPCRFVKELRLTEPAKQEVGNSLNLTEVFAEVSKVVVTGISKGKGFAGVIKRHGFGGFRATHGVKTHHRHPGSIGQCAYPGKVFKGKKMPGQMGNTKVTQKGITVVKIMPEKNLILLKGSIPGANGNYVFVKEQIGYIEPGK